MLKLEGTVETGPQTQFFSIFAGFMVWGNVFKVRKVLMGYPMHPETN